MPMTLNVFPKRWLDMCSCHLRYASRLLLFRRWTKVLRKIPHQRAFGLDKLLLFLWPCAVSGFTEGFVSGFSWLHSAWPCNHWAPGRAAVCFLGCAHIPCQPTCVAVAAGGLGGRVAKRTQFLIMAFVWILHLPQMETFLWAAQCGLFEMGHLLIHVTLELGRVGPHAFPRLKFRSC